MSDKISRREFVKAGTAASVAVTVPAAAFGQAPTVLVRRATPPVVISSGNGDEYRNGGPRTCVEEAWQRIARGEDVLDVPDRGSQHRGAGSRRDVRRLRRTAQRRRGRAARLLLHARPAEARRRSGLPRGRAYAVAGREGRSRQHRSPPARRGGGAGVRPRDGLHHRGRPQHRQVAGEVAGVEAPGGPGPLARSRRSARDAAEAARRAMVETANSTRPTAGARSTATGSDRRARSAA